MVDFVRERLAERRVEAGEGPHVEAQKQDLLDELEDRRKEVRVCLTSKRAAARPTSMGGGLGLKCVAPLVTTVAPNDRQPPLGLRAALPTARAGV